MPRHSQLGKISSLYLKTEIKNVQLKGPITNDLRVIWNNVYFALRKKKSRFMGKFSQCRKLFYQKLFKKTNLEYKIYEL